MMDWSSVKSVLGKFAPVIGTAVGGPLGGAAAAALASTLGIDEKSAQDPQAISAAIAGATPDQLLALKQADNDFKAKMAQLGFDSVDKLAALEVDDRKDARAMQVSTRAYIPAVLSVSVTLGFFGVLAFMLMRSVPAGSRDVLNIMLGALGGAWASIIAYYFGSSVGSDRKTELLSKAPPVGE